MRAKEGARLRLGDWVQLSTGRFAGAQGEVVEVILTHPRVGRARLRLPSGDDYWHPFWNEPMNDAEWRYTTDAEEMERYLHGLEGVASRRKWLLFVCGFIRLRPGNAHGDVERLMVEVLERYADEEIELASLRQFSRRLPLGDLIGLIAGGIDSLSSLRTYLLAIGIAIEEQAFERVAAPFKEFMRANVRDKDLALFEDLTRRQQGQRKPPGDVELRVLIPAFMISELRRGFEIGFLIVLPFLVIDLIVATVVMSMGMMMVSPAVFSLPCKILFFVLIDGWNLLVGGLVRSFA